MAAADQAEAGERRQAEHEQAVAEIADPVAGEQAQRHQPPEGGIAEALGIGAIEHAEHREGREQQPGEAEEPLEP